MLSKERLKNIVSVVLPHACVSIDFFPEYKEVDPKEVSVDDVRESAPYVFAVVNRDAISIVEEQLRSIPDIAYHRGVFRADRPEMVDFQVTDKDSNKFHAVNELRKIKHSSKEQTLAIGDSTNDLPLFANAGIKVAMGNAVPELKAEANYVVGSVHEDGFAEAMDRFVLN